MIQPTLQKEKVAQGIMQACDNANVTYRNSMDAAMEANSAMARGFEEISRHLGSLMQETMSSALSTSKNMMSARSVQEISEIQTGFLRDYFEQCISASNRMSEISARTTQAAFQPVARTAENTMNQTAKKIQNSQAA